MSNYNLKKFLQEEKKKKGVLDFETFKVEIQENAFTYAKLQSIFTEYKNQPAEMSEEILKAVMTKEEFNKVMDLNMTIEGREYMIGIIVSHIFNVNPDELVEKIIEETKKKMAKK